MSKNYTRRVRFCKEILVTDTTLMKVWQTSLCWASELSGLSPDRLNRIIRFLFIGSVLNLTLLVAVILMERGGIGYDLALLITNVFGLCLNYFLNRAFVFKNVDKFWRTASLYAATYASVYVLQLFIYRAIFSLGIVHEYVAITLTIVLSAIYAYFMLEKVVFSDRGKPT